MGSKDSRLLQYIETQGIATFPQKKWLAIEELIAQLEESGRYLPSAQQAERERLDQLLADEAAVISKLAEKVLKEVQGKPGQSIKAAAAAVIARERNHPITGIPPAATGFIEAEFSAPSAARLIVKTEVQMIGCIDLEKRRAAMKGELIDDIEARNRVQNSGRYVDYVTTDL